MVMLRPTIDLGMKKTRLKKEQDEVYLPFQFRHVPRVSPGFRMLNSHFTGIMTPVLPDTADSLIHYGWSYFWHSQPEHPSAINYIFVL